MYIDTFIKNTDIFISYFKLIPMICEFCVVARQRNIWLFTENYRK